MDFTEPLIASLIPRFQYIRQQADLSPNQYHTQVFRDHDLSGHAHHEISIYKKFCQWLVSELQFKEQEFDSIYATYDDIHSRHSAQNPHFDRIPTLKFMLYVNSLTPLNGAFCLSRGSHHWTNNIYPLPRQPFNTPGFQETTRDIPKYILQRMKPVEGHAGTIIIFHTDCIHHQGLVTEGSSQILRAHFRQTPSYNPPSNSFGFATF